MNIPNLPTDSLYKFVALGGLLLTIFSLYFVYTIERNAKEEQIIFKKESIVRQTNITLLASDKSGAMQLTENQKKVIDEGSSQVRDKDLLKVSEDFLIIGRVMFYSTLIAGIIMSFFGFRWWYTKIQKHQDIILENEALKYIKESKNETKS